MLVRVGLDIVLKEGLANGAEHVTFKKAYEILRRQGVRLTNGSVIGRVFETQEDYQLQVVAEIAKSDSDDFNDVAVKLFQDVLLRADRTTVEGRWRALSELCRMGSKLMLDSLHDSPTWRAWIGIWALTGSSEPSDARDEIMDALRASYLALNRDTTNVFNAAIDYLGFRLKEPYTMNRVATIVTALSEGSSIRDLVDRQSIRYLKLPSGPNGKIEQWTLFGVGFHAMIREFLEIDADWEVPSP